jgi:hypothetical protein
MSNLSSISSALEVRAAKPATSQKPYLLTCPFCKRLPKMTHEAGGNVRIECSAATTGCSASAYVVAEDEATAVSFWNRRPG